MSQSVLFLSILIQSTLLVIAPNCSLILKIDIWCERCCIKQNHQWTCKPAAFTSVSLLNMLYEQRINIFSFWRAAACCRPHSRWQAALKCVESKTSCRRSTWQERNHCVPPNTRARFLKYPLECFQTGAQQWQFQGQEASHGSGSLHSRWKRFDFRLTEVRAGNESEHLFNTMKTVPVSLSELFYSDLAFKKWLLVTELGSKLKDTCH